MYSAMKAQSSRARGRNREIDRMVTAFLVRLEQLVEQTVDRRLAVRVQELARGTNGRTTRVSRRAERRRYADGPLVSRSAASDPSPLSVARSPRAQCRGALVGGGRCRHKVRPPAQLCNWCVSLGVQKRNADDS
jgi:hypothetical protein